MGIRLNIEKGHALSVTLFYTPRFTLASTIKITKQNMPPLPPSASDHSLALTPCATDLPSAPNKRALAPCSLANHQAQHSVLPSDRGPPW